MISTTQEFRNTTGRPDLNMWCERGSRGIGKRLRKSTQCTTAENPQFQGKKWTSMYWRLLEPQVDVAVIVKMSTVHNKERTLKAITETHQVTY